ncbi:CAP domain-containing protein [Porcipelethomonas sp.]|uniref:CAP domain-containing protein n=1 Tax=Porcipelethomonas sp. TaxID=2981675 RepID=UPI003EF35D58
MKYLRKSAGIIISAACILSSFTYAANAQNYTYNKNGYWYYADETSFRYSDFDADENGYYPDGTKIDFLGSSPESLYQTGKTDYTVTCEIDGSTLSVPAKIGLCGDANMDGQVNIRDASFIARCAAGNGKYESDFSMFLADADRDNAVTIKDAAYISRVITQQAATEIAKAKQEKAAKINRVLELVNIERKNAGLNPLTLDSNISQVSNKRAVEIAVVFDHQRPDGSPWSQLLYDYNINFRYSGENIAAGYTTPEEVVKGWMNSEGHRANILDPDFTKIGIGYYYDENSDYGHYWVQTFVQPK